jgi:hypothetical protein
MSRYAIWNKHDPILTPVGEVISAEKWIERYPIAGVPSITVVCAGGEINGGFFGTLGQMVEMYTKEGCDFSACVTPDDKIAAIEAFEDEKEAEEKAEREAAKAAKAAKIANDELNAMSMASIAAQLEYQNMMTLEDVEG